MVNKKLIGMFVGGIFLGNFYANFLAYSSKECSAAKLREDTSSLIKKTKLFDKTELLGNEAPLQFDYPIQISDSLRIWRESIDSITSQADSLKKEADKYFRRSIVFGYFIN